MRFLALILALTFVSQGFSAQVMGHLVAKIVIVEDLQPKPVVLTDFAIEGPNLKTVLRTDADGVLSADLAPGDYTLSNSSPLTYKENLYLWKKTFTIKTGETTNIILTQADATVTAKPATRQVSDEAKLYQRYKGAVVTIESDTSNGSGFLIDSKTGLFLTNYHVVANSMYLAVRFRPGVRYAAKLVCADQDADVALVAIQPDLTKDIEALPLLPASESIGIEGEKVLAIGNPLHQESALTQGIISKVESDVIISDVNINHGNSGGPLLNMLGQVIGINTFGDFTTNGPGISGIVSIRNAEPLVIAAQASMAKFSYPSAKSLPDISNTLTIDQLKRGAARSNLNYSFLKAPRNFRTYFITPFELMARQLNYEEKVQKLMARRYKTEADKAKANLQAGQMPFSFWHKYVGNELNPVIGIQVMPWPQEKSASVWNKILWGSAARTSLEYRDDYRDMQLLRNGTVMEPIRRLRSRDVTIYADYDISLKDATFWGMHLYDPSIFAPGAELELRIWKNAKEEPEIVKIDKKMQERYWQLFRPYYGKSNAGSNP